MKEGLAKIIEPGKLFQIYNCAQYYRTDVKVTIVKFRSWTDSSIKNPIGTPH